MRGGTPFGAAVPKGERSNAVIFRGMELKVLFVIRKPLTSFGYLMERLGISAAMLSRELHVDASLVSKWKRGTRTLSRRSPYFREVVRFFWSVQQKNSKDQFLSVLKEINPTARFANEGEFFAVLGKILEGAAPEVRGKAVDKGAKDCVEVTLYDKSRGHRDAMDRLLKMAECMDRPGHLIFIEAELFSWLLDDETYCSRWCRRLYALLERGFTVTIALHFTLKKDLFSLFFMKCSPLLFHRNIDWYSHTFYDENIYWFSFAILEHCMSIMTTPLLDHQSTSMVFTDSYSVQQHKNVATMVLSSCRRIFRDFSAIAVKNFLNLFKKHWPPLGETLYTFLPVPAMIYAEKSLLRRILKKNAVNEGVSGRYLELNGALHRMFSTHRKDRTVTSVWEIFQIEEMERRINEGFISCSLSLLGLDPIIVGREEYALALENIVAYLKKYQWYNVALVSEKNQLLPNMNCWCMKSCWTVQMDEKGLRFCDEATFSAATSTALEISLKKIPAEQKNKENVEAIFQRMIRRLRS